MPILPPFARGAILLAGIERGAIDCVLLLPAMPRMDFSGGRPSRSWPSEHDRRRVLQPFCLFCLFVILVHMLRSRSQRGAITTANHHSFGFTTGGSQISRRHGRADGGESSRGIGRLAAEDSSGGGELVGGVSESGRW